MGNRRLLLAGGAGCWVAYAALEERYRALSAKRGFFRRELLFLYSPTACCDEDGLDGNHGAMKAYSKDLRQKIVDAIQRGMPKAQAARTFGVGISTLKRYATKAQRGEP